MTTTLAEKIAIVTGGTRGIGRAIAETLLMSGASVAICGRSQGDIDRAVEELSAKAAGKVFGGIADVGEPSEVARFFRDVDERFGRLDVLVNNAGVGIFRNVSELTVQEWRTVIRTNLDGVFYCCREAIPRMKLAGGGAIINVSSLAGKNPFAGGAAYNASKFGLNGFTEAMMLDVRSDNIRVSYVMPGSVDTHFGLNVGGASWKIAPQDIADIVLSILELPQRTLASRVEVRPSRPEKG